MIDASGMKSSQASSLEDLFSLLSCNDMVLCNQAKDIIIDGLINSVRAGETGSWLLSNLIDYYIRTNCNNASQMLTKVHDSQANFLFDKINNHLSNNNTCLSAVMLLGYIARSQPSWLYRIGNNAALPTLLKCLKKQDSVEFLMCGILTLTIILPCIPILVKPYISDMLEIFIRLVGWRVKNPGLVNEVAIQHLQISVDAFFKRLYGMFPCTCISLLKSFYKHKSNQITFEKAIQPILDRLLLHPLLITSDCEDETHLDRWRRKEPYEIVVESSKFSQDNSVLLHEPVVKAAHAFARRCPYTYQYPTSRLPHIQGDGNSNSLSTTNQEKRNVNDDNMKRSKNKKSSTESVDGVKVDDFSYTKLTTGYSNNFADKSQNLPLVAFRDTHQFWSPSSLLGVDTIPSPHSESPKHGIHNPSGVPTSENVSVAVNSSLDSPIEASSDFPFVSTKFVNSTTTLGGQTSFDREKNVKYYSNKDRQDIVPNESASEIDIASSQDHGNTAVKSSTPIILSKTVDNKSNPGVIGNSQRNIEDQKKVSGSSVASKPTRKISTVTRPTGKAFGATDHMETEAISVDDPAPAPIKMFSLTSMDLFASEFSNCEDAHVTPEMHSWPPTNTVVHNVKESDIDGRGNSSSESRQKSEANRDSNATDADPIVERAISENEHTIDDFDNSDEGSGQNSYLSMCKLFDAALPIPNIATDMSINRHSARVPPSELDSSEQQNSSCSYANSNLKSLEEYLKLASNVYSEELNRIPLVDRSDTNWIQFGGSAPADEINICRGQARLLLNQVLFERYQKEMYAQRNRQLVGRTFRLNALEEECLAMKDQLRYQEADIHHMKVYLKLQEEEKRRMIDVREKWETEVKIKLQNLAKEKLQLQERVDQLLGKLSTILPDMDQLKQDLKRARSNTFNAEAKLHNLNSIQSENQTLNSMVGDLRSELTILREHHHRQDWLIYRNMEANLVKEKQQLKSCRGELSARNELLRKQEFQLDSLKCQVLDLEKQLKAKESALKLEKEMLKGAKEIHSSQLEVTERKYQTVQKICRRYESYILKLHSQLEQLQKEKGIHMPAISDSQVAQSGHPASYAGQEEL